MSASNRPLVLVTGSEGLIGRAVVDALTPSYDVASFDIERRPHKLAAEEDFINVDLTDDASVAAGLAQVRERHGNRIASVVHLAAYYDFSGKASPLYRKLTVEGTRSLLRHLQSFEVEQFQFSSTHIVMAPSETGERIREDSEVDPAWAYPRSKLQTELLIADERGKIPAVILRIAGVYNEEGHTVPIAQQIDRIYNKTLESYLFPGDASHGQAFVHLDDLVDVIRLAIERRAELDGYEVFLVAEPDLLSYDDLQDQIGELIHGREWPTIRIPGAVAKAGAWAKNQLPGDKDSQFIQPWMIDLADDNYPLDVERARRQLGWSPKHRLRDTLPAMIASLKRDPVKWYKTNGLPVPERLQVAHE